MIDKARVRRLAFGNFDSQTGVSKCVLVVDQLLQDQPIYTSLSKILDPISICTDIVLR